MTTKRKRTRKPVETMQWFTILRWSLDNVDRVEVIHFYGTRASAEIRATAGMDDDDPCWQFWPGRANVSVEVETSV